MVLGDEQIRRVIETINSTDKQLNLYEELAPIYEHLYADGYDFEEQATLVRKYTEEKNPTVVDLGCGTGELIQLLAAEDPKGNFIGVDLSKNLLESARSGTNPDNVKYVELDYNDISQLDESVNTYVSFGSLTSHTSPEEMQDILTEIHETLEDGGRLIVDYHSPVQATDDGWVDSDGHVGTWENETESFLIECTIITVNRGDETHYTVGYEITDMDTEEKHWCSQKIPLQFYKKEELEDRFRKAGFSEIELLDTAPDRSGTIVAKK